MSVSISGDGSVTGIDQGLNVVGVVTATQIRVGSAVTIHSGGYQVGSSDIHSTGITVNAVNSSGVSTFSGGIVVAAGSTAAPSISPSGDSNTGIFFPSPDTVAIGEGGVEVLRVNSSGNVGIGTTTPSEKLSVNGRIESLQDGVGEGGQLILRASPTPGAATQYRWVLDNYDSSVRGSDRLRFVRENDSDSSSGVEYMSINTNGNLQFRTAGTRILNTSGNTILRQSGSVIQVVTNTIATGTYNLTATTETVIYNPMITITPTNSNSLIFFDIQFYGYHNPNNDFYTSLWVRRNSSGTAISSTLGTTFGDWTRNFGSMVATSAHADYHFSCWDLPGTTSAVNYLLTGLNHSASRSFVLWHASGSSNMRITAFEVAQ